MGIILNDIVKKYSIGGEGKEQIVLNGMSLAVSEGEMIAIKGKSGVGKSTLLHIMGLLDVMDGGSYLLDDIDVKQLNNNQRAKLRNNKIGFILQDYGLIEDETVLYNVGLPLMFSSEKLGKIQLLARQQLKKFGVDELADKKVSVLSGGEKQRVAIARALVNNPDYIMADEPTGALDHTNANRIIEILKILNSEGNTIIIVTHDDDVANSCERIVTIGE